MRTFLSDVFSLMIGNLFTQVVGFVLSLVMLQRLSRAEFGLQSALVALAGMVMAVAGLGMPQIAARELARRPADQQRDTYRSLLSFQLLLSCLVYVGAILIAWILRSFPGEQFIIFILALFTLVLSYAPIIPTEALFAVRGRARLIAVLQSFYALCTTVVGVTILSRNDNTGFARLFKGWGQDYSATILSIGSDIGLIYIGLSALSVITITLYLRKAKRLFPTGFALTYRPREWRDYLKQAVPSGLSAAFQQACLRLGVYIVYTMVSSENAGYLGVSNLLLQAILSIIWIPFSINILPVMTRLYEQSRTHWMWVGSRSATLLLAVTLPISVGTTLLAPDILRILSETQTTAAPTLRLFIWVLPPITLGTFLYQMLLIQARLNWYLAATAVGAAINIGLCLILIPPYHAEGAAVAAVIGLSIIAVICLWLLRDWLLPNTRLLDGLRLAAALVGMIIVLQATAGISVFVRIGLAALVYCVAIWAAKLFTAQDRDTALSLLATVQAHTP